MLSSGKSEKEYWFHIWHCSPDLVQDKLPAYSCPPSVDLHSVAALVGVQTFEGVMAIVYDENSLLKYIVLKMGGVKSHRPCLASSIYDFTDIICIRVC